MKQQLSDEHFDNIMKAIVNDASLNETEINDIAESPALWWSVQREINLQNKSASPWPPALKRLLLIGVPTFAVLALVSIFVFRPTGEKTEQAGLQQYVTPSEVEKTAPTITEPAGPATVEIKRERAKVNRKPDIQKIVTPSHGRNIRNTGISTIASNVVERTTEIKSDFIALTYARRPESGQVVRVKVPSSMMVTLGLVSSVEKPSNLVDAEVLVGDDGMTHSIRFIR